MADLRTAGLRYQHLNNIRAFKWALAVMLLCSLKTFGKTEHILEKKTKDFGTGIQVAHGLQEFHNTCLLFRVFFIPAKFFKGLQEGKTATGTEFRKHHSIYQVFPERLVVDVEITATKCLIPEQGLPLGFGEGLLSEASFDFNWKDVSGVQRPATLLSHQERHWVVGLRWDYFLELSSKDVPLTDNLIGDVSLRKGITHIRFVTSLHDNAVQYSRE